MVTLPSSFTFNFSSLRLSTSKGEFYTAEQDRGDEVYLRLKKSGSSFSSYYSKNYSASDEGWTARSVSCPAANTGDTFPNANETAMAAANAAFTFFLSQVFFLSCQ